MSFASGGFDSCVIKDESDNEGCWKLHLISSGSLFWCGKIWIFTSRRFCYYDLMSLLSSICGVSFCWGPARVNFDSSVFWNCIFTTEKNLVNTSSHNNKIGGNWKFKFFHIKTMNRWKSNVIFNNLHPLIHL